MTITKHIAEKRNRKINRQLRFRELQVASWSADSQQLYRALVACDYLTDDHLIGLFAGWRETLNENGVLYIAFKNTERYDQTPYQWHLDWFFYQRTLQDVLKLYERAGFDIAAIQTSRDSTEIIISFLSRETTPKILRVDSGASGVPPKSNAQPVTQPAFQTAQGSADDEGDRQLSR